METLFSFGSLILIFGIFWFFLIRPQQKRQKEHQKMVENLERGDKVVTIGGIYGTITKLKEDRVTLRIANDTNITLSRSAVGQLQDDGREGENGSEGGEAAKPENGA